VFQGTFPVDRLTPEITLDLARLLKLKHPSIIFPRKADSKGTLFFKDRPYRPHAPPTTPISKLRIIFAVAEGLRYLHEHDILHCISIDSVVLGEGDEPFIVDPGPLQLLMAAAPAVRSKENDVFAFGSFVYEVLAGRAVASDDELSFDDKVPVEYASLIRNCLDSNPDRRPTFTSIVRQFLAGELFLPNADISEFQNYLSRKIEGKFAARWLIDTLTRASSSFSPEPNDGPTLNIPTNYEGLISRLTR
jgi:serine/threonine protein kinase